ncbi:MAG: ImmA/IrrE family metallo-endopeptidase [Candidatus Symbiobacter sp.]|nr:ImmA/IrrE family metallo-endopeptidase [Candidatus Symbiobacter sp.]
MTAQDTPSQNKAKAKPNYLTPTPCELGISDIIKMAQTVAENWGYHPQKSFDNFLEPLGGRLIEQSNAIPSKYCYASSAIEVRGLEDFTIHTRELTETKKRRFEIAHEFAHYILHYYYPVKKSNKIFDKSMWAARCVPETDDETTVEQQADIFAQSFLLNEKLFREKMEEYSYSKLKMTYFFKISRSSIVNFGNYLGVDETKWRD